jgi:nicotinate-nucleotide pyrophosphorylase (carboxylating)
MDWYSTEIDKLIRQALREDIGAGDATSEATIPATAVVRARIIARAPLVCAGLPIAQRIFHELDPEMEIQVLANEGDTVDKRRALIKCSGNARAILAGERTALNFVSHLSGIATLTARFVKRLAGTSTKIRDTRKSTPGLRALEKYAVRMGGGTNHRFGLYDAILLKENHIALAGGIKAALERAYAFASLRTARAGVSTYESTTQQSQTTNSSLPIQIEVRDEREVREALEAGAEALLLDNMTPEAAKSCVILARKIRPDCVVEISGGITLDNVRDYAETGADFLASGTLTHSAPAANLSLLVDSIEEK